MNLLEDFLTNGTRPKSQRETSALLDAARSILLETTNSQTTMSKLFTAEDQAFLRANKGSISALTAHKAAQASKAKTPILDALVANGGKLPTAAATAAPIASAPKPTTAAAYEPEPVTMTLAEFDKLSSKAKSAFCLKTKGRIIA